MGPRAVRRRQRERERDRALALRVARAFFALRAAGRALRRAFGAATAALAETRLRALAVRRFGAFLTERRVLDVALALRRARTLRLELEALSLGVARLLLFAARF